MTLRRLSLKRRDVEFVIMEHHGERLWYAVATTPGTILYAPSLPELLGEIGEFVKIWHSHEEA